MANIELNPDIQTGRNVYVDADLYESDDAYKAKVDSYVNEGFRLVYGDPDTPDEPSEGGGDSGGDSTALIVEVIFVPPENPDLDDGSVELSETFGTIKEAVLAGRVVYAYGPDGGLDSVYSYYPIRLAVPVDSETPGGFVYIFEQEGYFEAEADDVCPHEPRGQ